MKLIMLLPTVIAAVAITLWSILWVSLPLGIIIGIAWLLAGLIIGKFTLAKLPLQISIVVGMVVITSIVNFVFIQQKGVDSTDKNNSEQTEEQKQKSEEKTETPNPEGTIVVEAGSGTLNLGTYDTLSYMKESSRGLEVYLGSKNTTASYNIEAQNAGQYALWVKLSDDALHQNNTRSARIIVNNQDELIYQHVSEDTKGWKYYNIGSVNLRAGTNKIDFTKIADTTAAYVMDEFKLIPLGSNKNL